MDTTIHTTVTAKQIMQYFTIFPPLGGASSILKWNGIYIAPYPIVREITNDPQVASGTTREEPYFYCHLLHRFFFSKYRVPWTWFPQKGRSGRDASTQMIASLHCITTQIPRRDKINSHISSIITGKKNPTEASDKVAQVITENTRLQGVNKRSLNQM